ncbi:MAG: hypothetical protein AAGB93_11930 [Planctomycetota bacterium]
MNALVRAALLLAAPPSLAAAQVTPPAQWAARSAPSNDAVVVVDPSGAGDFLEVATAVSAAAPRTLVLVRSGTYAAPVTVRDRGLTLQADADATVVLTAPLLVEDVGAGHGVVVSGIELSAGFAVEDCAGTVRFDGCTTPPSGALAPPPPGSQYWEWPSCGFGLSGQSVRDSGAVAFVGCALHGADGAFVGVDGAPGQHGLQIERSTVALYHTVLRGGDGAPATASGHYPVASGAGGDGLRVRDASSVVRHCGLDAVGGSGGTFAPGPNGSFGVMFGCDGVPVRADAGSDVGGCVVDDLAFDVDPIVRDDVLPWYRIEAPAQSPVFLMLSPRSDWRTFAPASGVLHLHSSATVVPLGAMPSSGALFRPLPVTSPTSVLGHVRVEVQVYARVQGVDRYSEPRTVVVVDRAL